MLKGTKLYSILAMKCPKCQKGDLFRHKNAYRLKYLTMMYDKCPCCEENFNREPGFYFGAAYVSYALTVALWIADLAALMIFDRLGLIRFSFFENPVLFLSTGVITLLILLPVIYRLSRSIWINFFTSYDKTTAERVRDCNPGGGK